MTAQTKPTPEEIASQLHKDHGAHFNAGVEVAIAQALKSYGDRIRSETIAECAKVADEYVQIQNGVRVVAHNISVDIRQLEKVR
jgi:hypothetical protein